MRIVEDKRTHQLAFHVGQVLIDEARASRRARERPAPASAPSCRVEGCTAPCQPSWRLCPDHARQLVAEQAEGHTPPFAAAA